MGRRSHLQQRKHKFLFCMLDLYADIIQAQGIYGMFKHQCDEHALWVVAT